MLNKKWIISRREIASFKARSSGNFILTLIYKEIYKFYTKEFRRCLEVCLIFQEHIF